MIQGWGWWGQGVCRACTPLTWPQVVTSTWWGFLKWQRTCLECGRPAFDPTGGRILWRRAWQPTPVFLPREFHGQRSLAATVHGAPKSQTWLSGRLLLSLLGHKEGHRGWGQVPQIRNGWPRKASMPRSLTGSCLVSEGWATTLPRISLPPVMRWAVLGPLKGLTCPSWCSPPRLYSPLLWLPPSAVPFMPPF